MLEFILEVVLLVLAMLVAVPALTGGNMRVHGGFFSGLLVLVIAAIVNVGLWFGLTLLTVGGTIVGNWLTFGLVGLLINGLAFYFTGRLMPSTLYVRSYGSAFFAGLIMTLASWAIHTFI
jgi:uncharacterized membrane protein YvlD (DUF360 family)